MIPLLSNSAIGYAVISSVVLLAIVFYTVYRLRKQVNEREEEEKKKNKS